MRDPERLSSSHGISDFERELLAAGKNEAMPAALREQMERALGLPGAAAGAPVRARVEAATGVKASAMVWISAGVVVLGVVGGLVGSRLGSRLFPPRTVAPVTAPAPSVQPASPSSAPAVVPPALAPAAAPLARDVAPTAHVSPSPLVPARRTLAVASPSRSRAHLRSAVRHDHGASSLHASSPANAVSAAAPAETAAPMASSAPPDDPTPATAARTVPARGRSTSEPSKGSQAPGPSGDLRAEIDLIDGARAALRAGDPSEALDLLGRHAVHFPHGALAPEETALRVEALLRLGRTAEARAYARRFIAADPASPLAERMRRLVNGATAP
jgi:hypothetical protein